MHITSLQVENIKRIKAASINPAGELVIIGGKNAAGKTSILDSIEMALAGKAAIPAEPIRRGSETARVVVTLDDGSVVERTFTEKGSYLVVKRGDGTKAGTPQALLDSLCSKVAFDPLAFMRAKPAEQANQLRGLVGIDFTAQDNARRQTYDYRTDVNRQVKQAEAAAQAMPIFEDAPVNELDVAELAAELKRQQTVNADSDGAQAYLTTNAKRLADMVSRADALTEQIAGLQAELTKLNETINKGEAWLAKEKDRVMALPRYDTSKIEQQIITSGTVNSKVRSNQQRAKLVHEAAMVKHKADELTQQIEQIDAAKARAMADAKWPIAGLGFSDTGVTFQGLPLEQASSAEQLRVSVAIGLAFNPKLKVLLIRDGSLLDADSLAIVGKMAADAGGQVWLEVVSEGSECSVVISDGMVVGAAEPELVAASNGHVDTPWG